MVYVNDTLLTSGVEVTANAINVASVQSGLNRVQLYSQDSNSLSIYAETTFWTGDGSLSVNVVDEQGQPLSDVPVRLELSDDAAVITEAVSQNGTGIFQTARISWRRKMLATALPRSRRLFLTNPRWFCVTLNLPVRLTITILV
ncbi:MAG: hypothetical protein ACRCYY_06555 [Trueperaceae bacterium]